LKKGSDVLLLPMAEIKRIEIRISKEIVGVVGLIENELY